MFKFIPILIFLVSILSSVVSNANFSIPSSKPAVHGSFPYHVALIISVTYRELMCSGSLISAKYVLTAAHCVHKASSATVILGANDIQNPKEPGQKVVEVLDNNFIIHIEWDPSNFRNDIALIRLPDPVHFTDYIRPILLSMKMDNSDNSLVVASGWGRHPAGEQGATTLHYTELTVLPLTDCKTYFGDLVRVANICTHGSVNTTRCYSDSGGPLIEGMDVSPLLIGVTSMGSLERCQNGRPAVYTRVHAFLSWIVQNSDIGYGK